MTKKTYTDFGRGTYSGAREHTSTLSARSATHFFRFFQHLIQCLFGARHNLSPLDTLFYSTHGVGELQLPHLTVEELRQSSLVCPSHMN